jgi:hypothetical protein
MEEKDIMLLNEMKQLISNLPAESSSLLRVVDKIDLLRLNLGFKDRAWDHELVQHIATLDSASTFVPKNDEQSKQTMAAIKTATHEIIELIKEKFPDDC